MQAKYFMVRWTALRQAFQATSARGQKSVLTGTTQKLLNPGQQWTYLSKNPIPKNINTYLKIAIRTQGLNIIATLDFEKLRP